MNAPAMRADELRARLRQLGLYGLLARADDMASKPWVAELLNIEEEERQRRSLDRRLRHARIGAFKSIADFDWTWPRKVEHQGIEELFGLEVLDDCPASTTSPHPATTTLPHRVVVVRALVALQKPAFVPRRLWSVWSARSAVQEAVGSCAVPGLVTVHSALAGGSCAVPGG